jgi:cephalosporin-C deacetylase-like acetyl esterase
LLAAVTATTLWGGSFAPSPASAASSNAPSAARQSAIKPLVTPYRASGIYGLREKAGWTVTLPPDSPAPAGKFAFTIKKNNAVVVSQGELDLSAGAGRIETALAEPAMLYMELRPPEGRPMVFGAAIAPTKLRPVAPRPNDFDAFWKRKIAEMKAVPENPVLTPGDSGKPDVDYATIRMDHVNGTHVYGQIAKPKKPGKYPAVLILQWASPPYRLWSPWVADRAAEGWIALNIEPHDVLPTEPQSYYDALPAALKNYGSIGQEDRERSYFVEMYLRDYRAVDYLSHLPEWDGKTLLVMGTSMGGQQSLAVAGLHPKVTHLIVNVPAGCDLNGAQYGRQVGYPYFPSNSPKVLETAPYVDCVNFAPHIKATSLVAMGFVDTVSPPAGIWTAFNLIRGRKEAAPMVDSPHNNTATAEQQRPYTERAAAWMSKLVRGEKPEVRKLEVPAKARR